MPRAKSGPARRLRSNFNLGGEQAEADGLLRDAFYESGLYATVDSHGEVKCFLVGRTGSGKSAVLQRIEEDHPEHVIRINPEDLALPYIADLGVVKHLSSLDVHLDPLFIALWKHVLLIEIIKHRYKVDSPDAKQRFLATLKEKIKRDRSKQAALEYLDDFEGKFWCETDERVREITRNFESRINAEAGGKLTLGPSDISVKGADSQGESLAERSELINRFQRVVNETQLPRLNKMMSVLDDDVLDSPQNYTYIVIDDLDRDWADEKVANDLIRCLFRAVVDLKRVRNLKILVALRTNIFEALDFGARTGGQEEKFRALTVRVRWTRTELEALLDLRVKAAGGRYDLPELSGVSDLLPFSNRTRGYALDYILERTLMRPRDAIAFLNECLNLSGGKERLTWDGIRAAEISYSSNRLLALRDEWKPTYPGIDRVFRVFAGAPSELSRKQMIEFLDNCILLVAEKDFPGTVWMTEVGAAVWNGSGSGDWAEIYQPLIRLLYNVGFLGCARRDQVIYGHDEPDFMDRISNLREVDAFVVHPAFRAALDIT